MSNIILIIMLIIIGTNLNLVLKINTELNNIEKINNKLYKLTNK